MKVKDNKKLEQCDHSANKKQRKINKLDSHATACHQQRNENGGALVYNKYNGEEDRVYLVLASP